MKFEWDDEKAAINLEKHGVSFEDAAIMLMSEKAPLVIPDTRRDYGEVRTKTIGCAGDEIILAVIHTERSGTTRIISARKTNKKERDAYHAR